MLLPDWLRTLLTLGAAQGAFLAIVLARRRENRTPNRLLAGVMLLFALDLAAAVYHGSILAQRYPAFIGADFPLGLLYGPMIYLYARTLITPGHPLYRRDFWHALPFTAQTLYLLPFFLESGEAKRAYLAHPDASPLAPGLEVLTYLKFAHAFSYIAVTLWLLHRYRRHLGDVFSFTERVNLAWLQRLTGGIVLLSIGTMLLFVFGRPPGDRAVMGLDPTAHYDDVTLLALTAFVYAIGYLALRQPELYRAAAHPLPPDTLVPAPLAAAARQGAYARSGLSSEAAERLATALQDLMAAQHLYRESDLSLQDLAQRLDASPHNLTEVLNTRIGQSFYDFVNGYRVREVQARIADPAADYLTLLALGLEAGFKSKSSFYAAFRRHTGLSPAAYRKQVRRESGTS